MCRCKAGNEKESDTDVKTLQTMTLVKNDA